jgi:opacity protein-like surface antigen
VRALKPGRAAPNWMDMNAGALLLTALCLGQAPGLETSRPSGSPAPRSNTLELGVAGGASLPSGARTLVGSDGGSTRLDGAGIGFALRLAYLPSRWVGVEAEAAHAGLRTVSGEDAEMYAVRGHLLVQVPGRVAPFVVFGGGLAGAGAAGDDLARSLDVALHWGAGVKLFTSDAVSVRAEGRHVMTRGASGPVHDVEVLAGIAFNLASPGEDDAAARMAAKARRGAIARASVFDAEEEAEAGFEGGAGGDEADVGR